MNIFYRVSKFFNYLLAYIPDENNQKKIDWVTKLIYRVCVWIVLPLVFIFLLIVYGGDQKALVKYILPNELSEMILHFSTAFTPTPDNSVAQFADPANTPAILDRSVPEGLYIQDAKNINTSINFPDPIFKRILEEFVGVGKDRPFTIEDAESIKIPLDCAGRGIGSLQGIEFFSNISAINCSENKLKILDSPKNINLEKVFCNNNKITEININNLKKLTELHCYENDIEKLDLVDNVNISHIECRDNKINLIKMGDVQHIRVLNCQKNYIDNITFMGQPELWYNAGKVDISDNNFDCDDWEDVKKISHVLREKLKYLPQRYTTFHCP